MRRTRAHTHKHTPAYVLCSCWVSPLFNFLFLFLVRLFPFLYCSITLISPLLDSLSSHTRSPAVFFQWASSLPRYCPSLFSFMSFFLLCGILSQKPVSQPAGDLTRPFRRSTIRISSCRKTTSEGTLGSCCLVALIPNQPFIYNATLISVPPRSAVQIWEQQQGARGDVTCDQGQVEESPKRWNGVFLFSWRSHNLKWALSDIDKAATALMWRGHSGSTGVKRLREGEQREGMWPRRKTGNEMERRKGRGDERKQQRKTSEKRKGVWTNTTMWKKSKK